ncbi:MAG: DMT family transporter [Alphaproteobacteria bacterium]|jgi:drug/metabolite transporter (DMT)-like permease|nr:DMT family transporter [Alphaproteobacteria bacterium]
MIHFKSDATRGIFIMILGAGVLSLNDAVSKYLVESYPIGQILGLRQSAALLVILAYVWWKGSWRDLRINDRAGQAWRGGMHVVGAGLIIWALSLLPISTVTAIAFSSPIIVLLFSMRFVGESVSWKRWMAVFIGFAGVLVIIRPGGVGFEWALLVPMAAAIVSGLRDLMTRRLARTETSISVLFWASVLIIIAGLFTIPLGWKPVTFTASLWFIFNGMLNAGAHFLMIEALRLGDAALISPFRYTAILWATLSGFFVWHHVPDSLTMFGAALLIISGVIIARSSPGKT